MQIQFNKGDEWLLEFLENIVKTKETLGFNTTVGAELIRLAKNSLLKETKGAKLDQAIINNAHSRRNDT